MARRGVGLRVFPAKTPFCDSAQAMGTETREKSDTSPAASVPLRPVPPVGCQCLGPGLASAPPRAPSVMPEVRLLPWGLQGLWDGEVMGSCKRGLAFLDQEGHRTGH